MLRASARQVHGEAGFRAIVVPALYKTTNAWRQCGALRPSHSRRSSCLQLHRLGGVRVTEYRATIPCDIHGDFEIFKSRVLRRTGQSVPRRSFHDLEDLQGRTKKAGATTNKLTAITVTRNTPRLPPPLVRLSDGRGGFVVWPQHRHE